MLKSISSITNAIGALNYKGTWNASTNTPTIVSSVGVKGDYYVVSVAGTTNINGISNWGVGDWIVYNGATWQRVEGGADLNGVNITFTGTASGPTYETSNAAKGLTITNNEIDADGTDANIDILVDPKGTGGVGIGGDPTGVVAGVTITSKFCVKHDGTGQVGGFVHANNTTAASGSGVFACRSRGTIASPTVVQNNDRLATLSFAGYDGTDLALAAQIDVEVDGTPGSNDMPGRIRFLTTPDGTQSPVEAMRINNAQDVTISAGNLIIGTSAKGVAYPVTGGGSALAPAFSVYRNTTQTITSGVYTKVQLNAETFDTNNNFDSTTNFRFTPTVAGYYQINGKIGAGASTASTSMASAIYKNGAIYKYGPYVQTTAAESNVQDVIYFNGSTDYVELFVYITATTAVISSGAEQTYFSGVFIRGA